MGVPANSGALARQATMARARTRGEWRIADLRGAGGASAEAALGEFESAGIGALQAPEQVGGARIALDRSADLPPAAIQFAPRGDRKRVAEGKGVSVTVNRGGSRRIKKKQ